LTLDDSKVQPIRIRGSHRQPGGKHDNPDKGNFSPERLDLHRLGILGFPKRFD